MVCNRSAAFYNFSFQMETFVSMAFGTFKERENPAKPLQAFISRHTNKKSPQPFGWGLWSEWRESNSRPLEPHSSALPNCATPGRTELPRISLYIIADPERNVNTFPGEKRHFFTKSQLSSILIRISSCHWPLRVRKPRGLRPYSAKPTLW